MSTLPAHNNIKYTWAYWISSITSPTFTTSVVCLDLQIFNKQRQKLRTAADDTICVKNGFQQQPSDYAPFKTHHGELEYISNDRVHLKTANFVTICVAYG